MCLSLSVISLTAGSIWFYFTVKLRIGPGKFSSHFGEYTSNLSRKNYFYFFFVKLWFKMPDHPPSSAPRGIYYNILIRVFILESVSKFDIFIFPAEWLEWKGSSSSLYWEMELSLEKNLFLYNIINWMACSGFVFKPNGWGLV